MKILFAGTPEIAVPTLQALGSRGLVQGVLTAPDAPLGRSKTPLPPAVKSQAMALGISVYQPEKLDAQAREEIGGLGFDLLVSFAYGKIFGPKFLGLFPLGGVNIHPSLLPRWRGPSPINAALAAQDPVTGITVQTLALEMDGGDVLAQLEIPLDSKPDAPALTGTVSKLAPGLILDVLNNWESAQGNKRPQDPSKVTFCSLIKKDDGLINWSRSAGEIDAQVRALKPWPGAFTSFKGQKLSIWKTFAVPSQGKTHRCGEVVGIDKGLGILVQTGEGLIGLRELQLPGRNVLDFKSFLNGVRDLDGALLGEMT